MALESLATESLERSARIEPVGQGQTPHGTAGASNSRIPTVPSPELSTPTVFTIPPAAPPAYPAPPLAAPTAYPTPPPPVPAMAYSAPPPAVPTTYPAPPPVPPVPPTYIDPTVPPVVPASAYPTAPGVPLPACSTSSSGSVSSRGDPCSPY
ncbi:neural Wiskott-Aldrich syndrome protein-like [Zingiber officinale]|uniref:neural Wiskott-Aldrich syndrome protein-like n=1 Tax=Zingiber officinale TaxID=94328 RepID=UPI001C4C4DA0|nr:neural Wiskott-Aldrich syndrome protein-like [Zingiber officinale]